jgi:DNA repair protein RecO (recombination protein O)
MRGKVNAQPAYVLHTYPYRETSLIVQAFTRDFGRVALIARGARRPRSALRGLMMAFQPLELAWTGKGEVFTLLKAEWQGGLPLLSGQALFCGYYINELLMHLLPREDAHEALFEHYGEMLNSLGAVGSGKVQEADLRCFEKALLQELGYGLMLAHDAADQPLLPEQHYAYEIERGPIALGDPGDSPLCVRGQTLLDMHRDDFSDKRSRSEAKTLMRSLLNHYLGGVELESRKIFKELQEL